jgi:hypothetical protein
MSQPAHVKVTETFGGESISVIYRHSVPLDETKNVPAARSRVATRR